MAPLTTRVTTIATRSSIKLKPDSRCAFIAISSPPRSGKPRRTRRAEAARLVRARAHGRELGARAGAGESARSLGTDADEERLGIDIGDLPAGADLAHALERGQARDRRGRELAEGGIGALDVAARGEGVEGGALQDLHALGGRRGRGR